jgi:hypothetical protein
MTDIEIQRAASPRLRDRLADIREQLIAHPTEPALHLKAEREAIVAELDFRAVEEQYEAWMARRALATHMAGAWA